MIEHTPNVPFSCDLYVSRDPLPPTKSTKVEISFTPPAITDPYYHGQIRFIRKGVLWRYNLTKKRMDPAKAMKDAVNHCKRKGWLVGRA